MSYIARLFHVQRDYNDTSDNQLALYRTFRELMPYTFPFGGKVSLCLEAFRKRSLIVRAGSRSLIFNECVKQSVLSLLSKTLHMKQHMRLQAPHQDEKKHEHPLQLSTYLLKVGEGSLQDKEKGRIRLSSSLK